MSIAGAIVSSAFEHLKIGIGQQINEDGVRTLLQRGSQHLDKHAELLEAARLLRDLLYVCMHAGQNGLMVVTRTSRVEFAFPDVSVLLLLGLHEKAVLLRRDRQDVVHIVECHGDSLLEIRHGCLLFTGLGSQPSNNIFPPSIMGCPIFF